MIVAALGIVVLSVACTLYYTGVLSHDVGGEPGYKNITYTDAVVSCENHAHQVFGAGLAQLTVDDHSSRMEHQANRYFIFFRAVVDKGVYINCFVDPSDGGVTKFEVRPQDVPDPNAQMKDSGSLFGWPLKK